MGDFQTNKDGVVSGLASFVEHRFGISRGNDLHSGGNQEGFVRLDPYNTGSFSPGSSATAATRIECGRTCFSLTLDPDYTTPNAVIYVHFGSPDNRVSMQPGDCVDMPGGFDHFFIWNGHASTVALCSSLRTAIHASFLAGLTLGSHPIFKGDRPRRTAVNQLANWALYPTAPAETGGGAVTAGAISFAVNGLKGMRLSFYCIGGTAYIAAPSDLAVVVRPWVLVQVDVQSAILPVALGQPIDYLTKVAWTPAAENLINVTQFSRTFDRAVDAGALAVTLQQVSLVGTGVDNIMFSVDGY